MHSTRVAPVDTAYQLAFKIAYHLHLIWTYLFRPESHGAWVAVWCKGDLLLIKNSYRNNLTLPGGGRARGESLAVAALRELEEEVGIQAEPDDLLYWGQYRSTIEYKLDHINVYEIELTVLPDIQLDNREVVWSKFCSVEESLDMQLFPALRCYLTDKTYGAGQRLAGEY